MSSGEQKALAELHGDPAFYGILRPRKGSGYSIAQVGPDTALLFLTLMEPGPIPAYVRASFGDNSDRAIAQLVLDGVLKIESHGEFVSGTNAYAELCVTQPSLSGSGTLARLSKEALLYAQRLAAHEFMREPIKLAHKLYLYNHLPTSPRWRRRFAGKEQVWRELGLGGNGSPETGLRKHWQLQETQESNDPWFSWFSTDPAMFEENNSPYIWKLYISPWPDEVPETFRRTVKILSDLNALSFKVGNNASELLRSDKMVVYFRRHQDMKAAGGEIHRALQGVRPHGVPFTAELDQSAGLVSWGVDRQTKKRRLSWQAPESWRIWVTHRLAVALASAVTKESSEMEPWEFALARVEFERVDTETWTPLDLVEGQDESAEED
jgi:hypothetical protein